MKQANALFRNSFLSVVTLLLVALMLPGCSTPQKPQYVQRTIPVPEIQYVEATLIEGKTTKQEVLDALGMPDSASDSSLSYSYNHNNMYLHAKLHIIYKDGTELNVILGHGLKHGWVLIHFNGSYDKQGRHIPSTINTGISIG